MESSFAYFIRYLIVRLQHKVQNVKEKYLAATGQKKAKAAVMERFTAEHNAVRILGLAEEMQFPHDGISVGVNV